jgi:hypothetical protein
MFFNLTNLIIEDIIMTVKKVYAELYAFLEANKNKKVDTLMPEIMKMVESKQAAKNFITNEAGEVTHIFCYYHKKWEPVSEYGSKKHSPSGYNSMCKIGVNQWTKQQRDAKAAELRLLDDVAKGVLAPTDIDAKRLEIVAMKDAIIPREDGIGTDEI